MPFKALEERQHGMVSITGRQERNGDSMPTSQPSLISPVIKKIMELNPMSVLDIGAGAGKYGVLCREYLDLWIDSSYSFTRKIDCVEVFSNYITPVHRYVYNNIYQYDVFKITDKLKGYDLVLIIGTLEHFDKTQGTHLLYTLLSSNKGILISTPKVWAPQAAGFGNSYEEHKSVWTKEDFNSIGNTNFIHDENSLICYLTQHEQRY